MNPSSKIKQKLIKALTVEENKLKNDIVESELDIAGSVHKCINMPEPIPIPIQRKKTSCRCR